MTGSFMYPSTATSSSSSGFTKPIYSIDSFADGYSSRAREVSDHHPAVGRLNPGAKDFVFTKPSATPSSTGTSGESPLNLRGPTPRLNLTELLNPRPNLQLQQQYLGNTFDPRHEQEGQEIHQPPTASQQVHQESMNFLERLDLKALLQSQPPNLVSFCRPRYPSQDDSTHQHVDEEDDAVMETDSDGGPAVTSRKQETQHAPTKKKTYDAFFAHLESLYGTRKPEPRKAPKDIFERLSNPIMGHTSTLEARKKLLEAQDFQGQEHQAPLLTSRSTKNSKKTQAKTASKKKTKQQQNNQAENEKQQQQRQQKHDEKVAAALAAVAETLKKSTSSIEARKGALNNKLKSKPQGKKESDQNNHEDELQPAASGFFLTQHEAQEESLSKKIERLPSQAPPHALATSVPIVRKASRLNLAIAEAQQKQQQQEQHQNTRKEAKAVVVPTRPTTCRTGTVSSRLKDTLKSATKRPITRKFVPKKDSGNEKSNEKDTSAFKAETAPAVTPAKGKSLLKSKGEPGTPKTPKTPKTPRAVKVSKNTSKTPKVSTSHALLMGNSIPSKQVNCGKELSASSGSITSGSGTKTNARNKTQSSKFPVTRPPAATPSKTATTARKKLATSAANNSNTNEKTDTARPQQQQRKKILPRLNAPNATTANSSKRNTTSVK